MKSNGSKVSVSVTGPSGDYTMFDARDVTPRGAFLAGNLLLELNEEFTVVLAFADASTLRVTARVDRVERGQEPGIAVSFAGLTESEQKLLASKLGA